MAFVNVDYVPLPVSEYRAQGMKNSEPCICPEHATDEACPACVAGFIP